MKSKRERDVDDDRMDVGGGLDFDSKRQRVVSQSSPSASLPPPASENTLLPGFNYGDEDEEEDRHRLPPRNRNREDGSDKPRTGQNGVQEEEDEDDDDFLREQGLGQGTRKREIEIRRDCPYLDTVNRQVNH